MQTAPTPEQGLVFAPVSPAVAKLLHQLQAQIIREAQERSRTLDGEISLPAVSGWRLFDDDVDHLTWYADNHSNTRAIRRRVKPVQWGPDTSWHPSWYTVYVRRVDTEGRSWEHYAGDHVTDDFGTLVRVPRGLQ